MTFLNNFPDFDEDDPRVLSGEVLTDPPLPGAAPEAPPSAAPRPVQEPSTAPAQTASAAPTQTAEEAETSAAEKNLEEQQEEFINEGPGPNNKNVDAVEHAKAVVQQEHKDDAAAAAGAPKTKRPLKHEYFNSLSELRNQMGWDNREKAPEEKKLTGKQKFAKFIKKRAPGALSGLGSLIGSLAGAGGINNQNMATPEKALGNTFQQAGSKMEMDNFIDPETGRITKEAETLINRLGLGSASAYTKAQLVLALMRQGQEGLRARAYGYGFAR